MTKRRGFVRIKGYSYRKTVRTVYVPPKFKGAKCIRKAYDKRITRGIRVKGHWRKKPKKPRYEKVKAVLNIHSPQAEENYSLIIISYIQSKFLKTKEQRIAIRKELIKIGVRRMEENPGLYKLYRKADVEVSLKDRPEGLQRTKYRGKKRGTRIYLQDYQRDEEREL